MLSPATTISAPTFGVEYERPAVVQYESPLIIEPIKQDEPSNAVRCNCVAFVREKYYPNLPPMIEVIDNLQLTVSDVAVMYYAESGLYHYAKVIWTDGYNFTIDEANYFHCKISQRNLSTDYPRLIGFYTIK